MKFSLESSDDIADFYGGQEVLKRKMVSSEEKARRIRAVTPALLRKTAEEIFKDGSLNLALIGPFRQKGEFLKMLKF